MADETLNFGSFLDGSQFFRVLGQMESEAAGVAKRIGMAFVEGTEGVLTMADELRDLSEQTGATMSRLYVLGKNFRDAGLEADGAGQAINRMQRFLQQGGAGGDEKLFDALRKLHLNFLEIKDLSPEDQLAKIGKALAAIHNPAARSAEAMEIFGRSGAKLMDVFNNPAFTNPSDTLTEKGKLLERNAALFTETSRKLRQAGDILEGFFVGATPGTVVVLDTLLDQLNKVDLVHIGQMFGTEMVLGATSVVDMLLVLKKQDIVGQAKQFGTAMKDGASVFTDAIKEAAKVLGGIPHLLGLDSDAVKKYEHGLLGVAGYHGESNVPYGPPEAPRPTAAQNFSAAAGNSDASEADRVTVTGLPSLFHSPGMQWGQMNGQPIVNPAAKEFSGQGMQWGQFGGKEIPNSVRTETERVGLSTGSLFSGGLSDPGGLSGDGSDTAEASRQSTQKTRDLLQYQNPLMSSGALNAAVQQQQNADRDQARIKQFRENYDRQHPGAKDERDAKEKANKGATEKGQQDLVKAIEGLKTQVEKLFAS